MADKCHLKKVCEDVNLWNQWRKDRPDIFPDLRGANLQGAVLSGIDFRRTNLDGANLSDAKLFSALLDFASLCQTDLSRARLRCAHLHRTYFRETILQETNFYRASLHDTEFLNVDLSKAINLEHVLHPGLSTIGIDTIQRSREKIPDVFLRGAGVSEQLLDCIHSLGRSPFHYFTCFISYSSKDQHFVDILYRDLRKEGVFCWYAPENLKAGEKFPLSIMEAIQQGREKVLVVFSKNSLESKWVEKEVQLARQKEGKGRKEVLVPICLDGAVLNSTVEWAAAINKRRNIRSFENWQQSSHYQKMLKDLLNDLRKE